MVSSHPVAGDGVQHRAAQKGKADGYEQNVEHGSLIFRRVRVASNRLRGIKVRYALTGQKIRIS
jgi:hypothetical protein